MKRKMAYIGISFTAAMLIASFLSPKINLICALISALACLSAIILKRFRTYIIVISISLTSAFLIRAAYTHFYENRVLSYSGKEITMVGKTTDFSYYASDKMRISVHGKINGKTSADISFYTDSQAVDYEDEVTVKATVSEIQNTVDYSSKDYYNSLGVYLESSEVKEVSVTPSGFSIKKYILRYRDYLFETITDCLPDDIGGFLGAMLCGDKSELSGETKLSLYRSGLGHIFALSGTHVVIITGLFAVTASAIFKNKRLQSLLTLVIILLFTVFAGASPSVIRAALMAGLIHSAPLFYRKPDSLNSLGLAAFLITLISPAVVRSVSFVLSFTGAYSVSVLAPYILKRFEGTRFKLLSALIIPNIVISIVTVPISIFFFREISVVSPLANVILLPLCNAALSLTALIAAVGAVSFIAKPLLFVCYYLVRAVLWGAELLSQLPKAYLSTDSIATDITALIFCAAVLYILVTKKSLREAFCNCFAAAAAACALVCVSSMFPAKTRLYLLAKNSACAVVAVNNSHAVAFDCGGKYKLAAAVENLFEDKAISSADFFFCKNSEYLKSYYGSETYAEIQGFYKLYDSESELSDMGVYVSSEGSTLTVDFDGKEYVINPDEHTLTTPDGELDFSDNLKLGLSCEIE